MAEKNFKNNNGKRNNQKRNNTTKNISRTKLINVPGRIYEYKMPLQCARDILKNRKGAEAKKNPQQYLCEYVTEQYGLLGTCVRVLTY